MLNLTENESLLVLPKLEVVHPLHNGCLSSGQSLERRSKSRYSTPGIVMGGSRVGGTAGGASDDTASGTGSERAEVDGANIDGKGCGGTSLGSGSYAEC